MSLRGAVDDWLEMVGESSVWAAEVASVRMLADQLDDRPADTDLWREFRFALRALRGVVEGGGVDDEARELVERLGGAGLRDAEDVR